MVGDGEAVLEGEDVGGGRQVLAELGVQQPGGAGGHAHPLPGDGAQHLPGAGQGGVHGLGQQRTGRGDVQTRHQLSALQFGHVGEVAVLQVGRLVLQASHLVQRPPVVQGDPDGQVQAHPAVHAAGLGDVAAQVGDGGRGDVVGDTAPAVALAQQGDGGQERVDGRTAHARVVSRGQVGPVHPAGTAHVRDDPGVGGVQQPPGGLGPVRVGPQVQQVGAVVVVERARLQQVDRGVGRGQRDGGRRGELGEGGQSGGRIGDKTQVLGDGREVHATIVAEEEPYRKHPMLSTSYPR